MFIPQSLHDKIESLFPNESKTSLRKIKTYHLLSDMFYQIQVNENRINNDVFLYQFALSRTTLERLYKKPFYRDVFTKKIKADPGDDNFDTALLQSNGSYLAGEYPYSYRINPLYLTGKLIPVENGKPTYNELDYTKIKGKKFKKTAKWHTQFMKGLAVDEELISQTTLKHYFFKFKTLHISDLKANIYFVTKGNSEMIELFNDVSKNKPSYMESLLKTRLNQYYIHNKKKVFEDTLRLESIIANILRKQERGEINPESVIILYNDHLYVESSIDVFIESTRFSFLLRAQYHLELIKRRVSSYRVSFNNGRVFHNLTSINKHYLDGLLYQNGSEKCTLSYFDLKNAQPTVLANLILKDSTFIKAIKSSSQKNLRILLDRFLEFECEFQSATEFLELCVSGELYETLQNDFLKNKGISINRDFFKLEMLRVIFSKPNYYSNFIDLESTFPGLDKYLRDLKSFMGFNEFGKSNLAHLLQAVESFIFVESLHYEMAIQGIPGSTKHDCLIVPRDKEFKYIKKTEEIIENVFESICFKGTCKLEHTVIKNFEYPNREEFIIDRWDDKQSEALNKEYMKNPSFRGLI